MGLLIQSEQGFCEREGVRTRYEFEMSDVCVLRQSGH